MFSLGTEANRLGKQAIYPVVAITGCFWRILRCLESKMKRKIKSISDQWHWELKTLCSWLSIWPALQQSKWKQNINDTTNKTSRINTVKGTKLSEPNRHAHSGDPGTPIQVSRLQTQYNLLFVFQEQTRPLQHPKSAKQNVAHGQEFLTQPNTCFSLSLSLSYSFLYSAKQ